MEKYAKVIGYKFIKRDSPIVGVWEETMRKACPEIDEFYYDMLPSRKDWSKRIGVKKILEEAKNGRVRKIVVIQLSDLSRNPTEALTFIRLLKEYQVEFYCIAECVALTDNLTLKILEELAVQEKKTEDLLGKMHQETSDGKRKQTWKFAHI